MLSSTRTYWRLFPMVFHRTLVAFALVCVVASTPLPAEGSDPDETGRYPTMNFGARDYKAHAQNWAIVQAPSGLMYFANGTSILEYDGVKWRQIQTRGRAAVRSLATADDGRIYVGGSGDFGYLRPDSTGSMSYRSLSVDLDSAEQDFNEVWAVVPTPEGVYFSSRERLFRLQDDSVRSWTTSTMFALGFSFRDTFYTVVPGTGLMRMENDSLVLAAGGETFATDVIFFGIERPDNTIILGSRQRSLLIYDGGRIQPFAEELAEQLREDLLYHGTLLHDGKIALATRRAGLYLLNADGTLIRVLNSTDGLRDKHMWYAFEDRQRGLWLALNSGIARIDLNSPVSHYDEASGLPGIVTDVVRHQGGLYAATSSGLFRMTTSPGSGPRFESITNLQTGQCLTMLATTRTLFAGCELGLFAYEAGRLTRLIENNVRLLHQRRHDPDEVLVGSRDGLLRFRRTGSAWASNGGIDGLPGWVLDMHEEADGTLWITTVSDGIIRARLDGAHLIERTDFGQSDGLPEGWLYIAEIDGKARVHSMEGIFIFDDLAKRFVRDELLTRFMDHSDAEVFLLRQDSEGFVWMNQNNQLARFDPHSPVSNVEMISHLREAQSLAVYPDIASEVAWVAGEDGLTRYSIDWTSTASAPAAARIRRVSTLNSDSLLFGGEKEGGFTLALPPELNGLRFNYALPLFGDGDRIEYQTRLDGFDRSWSSWSAETSKDYTNLRAGTYTFQVRARDANGFESEVDTLTFRIDARWYQTWWAYLLAMLAGIAALTAVGALILRLRLGRLEARNRALEREVRDRTRTLERANRRLQTVVDQNHELLSVAAHDLKNPLVSIIGFSDLLRSGATCDAERNEFLSLIHESALRMNEAIDQIQTTDILENGRLELHLAPVDLLPLVGSVVRRNLIQADRKNIDIEVEAAGPVFAPVDRQYMPRVVDNLLSNAIKFSDSGSRVIVKIACDDRHAIITVADEGPGFTPDDLDRAFEKRMRLSARPTHGEGSTGLGLYIVKTLVESHGGDVAIDSAEGKGATLTVRLPLADLLPAVGDGASEESQIVVT